MKPKERRMASGILVNTGLGNGLLPDGTKPLPKPNSELLFIGSKYNSFN